MKKLILPSLFILLVACGENSDKNSEKEQEVSVCDCYKTKSLDSKSKEDMEMLEKCAKKYDMRNLKGEHGDELVLCYINMLEIGAFDICTCVDNEGDELLAEACEEVYNAKNMTEKEKEDMMDLVEECLEKSER
jgi:hypothetical protein